MHTSKSPVIRKSSDFVVGLSGSERTKFLTMLVKNRNAWVMTKGSPVQPLLPVEKMKNHYNKKHIIAEKLVKTKAVYNGILS